MVFIKHHPLSILLLSFSLLISNPILARENVALIPTHDVKWKDYLGVNAHFLWFQPYQYKHQMTMLQDLNLDWVRVDLHWDRHEQRDGEFDYSMIDSLVSDMDSFNLKGLVYLVGSAPFATSAPKSVKNKDQYPPVNTKDFAKRMAQLSGRYPSIQAWQIWNEQNTPAFWQPMEDPIAYKKLFSDSVNAIRAVNPYKTIVMGGMAYYSQMPVKGGLMLEALQKLDAFSLDTTIAYHPYSLTPEGDNPKALDFIRRAKVMNEHLRRAGVNDIWATEWGWSSYAGPVEEQPIIGEFGQADYLLRRLVLMSALDYDKIFLFALSDLDQRASVRDQSYGLLDLDGKPKLAYRALKYFFEVTGESLEPTRPPSILSSPDGLLSVSWSHRDGRKLWMYWAENKAEVKVKCQKSATLFDPLAEKQKSLKCLNGVMTAPVQSTLQIIKF